MGIKFSELTPAVRQRLQKQYPGLFEQVKDKPLKYRNNPDIVDGIRFQSEKEARRYKELKLLMIAGEIKLFLRQVPFDLYTNNKYVGRYFLDFLIVHTDGSITYEDVKATIFRKGKYQADKRRNPTKTSTYLLKKKMVEKYYGITITEI